MKGFEIEKQLFNKKTAWVQLYDLYVMQKPEELKKMLEIVKTFNLKFFYAICRVHKAKPYFDKVKTKCETSIINSKKKIDIFAVRGNEDSVDEIINFAALNAEHNDECTEIYGFDESSWKKFIADPKITRGHEQIALVINDNSHQPYIAFSLEKYTLDEVKTKIKEIL